MLKDPLLPPTAAIPFAHWIVAGRPVISMRWVLDNLSEKLGDEKRAKLKLMIEQRAKHTDILREIPELVCLLGGLSAEEVE